MYGLFVLSTPEGWTDRSFLTAFYNRFVRGDVSAKDVTLLSTMSTSEGELNKPSAAYYDADNIERNLNPRPHLEFSVLQTNAVFDPYKLPNARDVSLDSYPDIALFGETSAAYTPSRQSSYYSQFSGTLDTADPCYPVDLLLKTSLESPDKTFQEKAALSFFGKLRGTYTSCVIGCGFDHSAVWVRENKPLYFYLVSQHVTFYICWSDRPLVFDRMEQSGIIAWPLSIFSRSDASCDLLAINIKRVRQKWALWANNTKVRPLRRIALAIANLDVMLNRHINKGA